MIRLYSHNLGTVGTPFSGLGGWIRTGPDCAGDLDYPGLGMPVTASDCQCRKL